MVSTLTLIIMWQQRWIRTADCWVSNRFPPTRPVMRSCWPGWVGFGSVIEVGVEGTGSWGVGLSRFLGDHDVMVVEVDRPNRQKRRKEGKSDPTDAVAAARAALSGEATVIPKTRNGPVEQIRVLMVARRSAREQRIQTLNQLRHLVFTASEEIRVRFKDRPKTGLITEAANMRPRKGSDPVTFTTYVVIRNLARRIRALNAEIKTIDEMLTELITETAPELFGLYGVGTDIAASLLVAAGDKPDRIGSEGSWAHLCGVAPLPASSGKTVRHRLNRGGDRNANAALYRIVLTRMSSDHDTRRYVTRRREEGLNTAEIMRCLKRYVIRDVDGRRITATEGRAIVQARYRIPPEIRKTGHASPKR